MSKKNIKEAGFSLIELCIVVMIILVMSTVSLYYLTYSKKLYAAEDQILQLSDILQDAKQKAFTQKEVMRVEINQTTRTIRLIEENLPNAVPATAAADDRIVKEIPFFGSEVVRYETNPTNVTTLPVDKSPTPKAVFSTSLHPLSLGNSVCTIRFLRSGMVTNAGTVVDGSDAIPTGVTVQVWKPKTATSNESIVDKAITIGGSSGTIRLWSYKMDTGTWVDVRLGL
jgi:type II secretory pathway pseudopilin PulG